MYFPLIHDADAQHTQQYIVPSSQTLTCYGVIQHTFVNNKYSWAIALTLPKLLNATKNLKSCKNQQLTVSQNHFIGTGSVPVVYKYNCWLNISMSYVQDFFTTFRKLTVPIKDTCV
jgi:hypothetical protein